MKQLLLLLFVCLLHLECILNCINSMIWFTKWCVVMISCWNNLESVLKRLIIFNTIADTDTDTTSRQDPTIQVNFGVCMQECACVFISYHLLVANHLTNPSRFFVSFFFGFNSENSWIGKGEKNRPKERKKSICCCCCFFHIFSKERWKKSWRKKSEHCEIGACRHSNRRPPVLMLLLQ